MFLHMRTNMRGTHVIMHVSIHVWMCVCIYDVRMYKYVARYVCLHTHAGSHGYANMHAHANMPHTPRQCARFVRQLVCPWRSGRYGIARLAASQKQCGSVLSLETDESWSWWQGAHVSGRLGRAQPRFDASSVDDR
jgi:hypothetical protein